MALPPTTIAATDGNTWHSPEPPKSREHPATGTEHPRSKEKSKYNATDRDGVDNG